jgi:4-amino-4-deoxy-L-arabinose transferase-like glycosyltransferase
VSRKLLVLALIAWLAIAVTSLVIGPPLGHDESAFGVAARGGGAAWLYRSTGVIWIAKIGLALGGSEVAMRLASVLLGLGVVVAAWMIGSRLSPKAGGWAALVVAGAHPMALRSAELIGDLPATACVLAGVAIMAEELTRDTPRWRLVWIAPLFALGFYFRYGSAPVIAIAAVAALLIWPRKIFKAPVVVAVLAFFALLAPHAIESMRETGSLFGILEVSSKMPRRAYVGEGLVTYLTSNPFRFYGGIVAPLIVAGLVALVRPTRTRLFFGAIAIGQIVAIGLQSHAQPRYVFVATTLLVALGVDVVTGIPWKPWLARIGMGLVGLAWLATLIISVPYNRWLASERAPLLASAAAIDGDGTDACVFACRVVTQLLWYTPCDSVLLRDVSRLPQLVAPRSYVVSVPHGIVDIAPIAAHEGAKAIEVPTGNDRAHVWRLSR